ncbi:hypothetical protein F4677DRAFT_433327 [Hypoxylon crocopeplum]|nr:hypothetical protein F4677DRAFT_433327 [Hypoxylon crocopeplum]
MTPLFLKVAFFDTHASLLLGYSLGHQYRSSFPCLYFVLVMAIQGHLDSLLESSRGITEIGITMTTIREFETQSAVRGICFPIQSMARTFGAKGLGPVSIESCDI